MVNILCPTEIDIVSRFSNVVTFNFGCHASRCLNPIEKSGSEGLGIANVSIEDILALKVKQWLARLFFSVSRCQ